MEVDLEGGVGGVVEKMSRKRRSVWSRKQNYPTKYEYTSLVAKTLFGFAASTFWQQGRSLYLSQIGEISRNLEKLRVTKTLVAIPRKIAHEIC